MIKKIKDSIKAQAALEFLTTYGWAFLVILIMIGTLAYFGVLSPGKILPNRCLFGTEFQCIDYRIQIGQIDLKLKNSVGEAIDVDSYSIGTEATTSLTCTVQPTVYTSWKSGESKTITWGTCAGGGLSKGDKGKVLIGIQYHVTASSTTYSRNVTGEIYSTVG